MSHAAVPVAAQPSSRIVAAFLLGTAVLFLTDLGKFTAANAIMAEIIPQPFPARSTIGVASLPKGAQFEVEAIMVL